MGYSTFYTLQLADASPQDHVAIGREAADGDVLADIIDQPDCRWYEHEADLQRISAKYPHVVFRLAGDGEESGDVWVKWFLNGMKIAEIQMELPPEPENVAKYKYKGLDADGIEERERAELARLQAKYAE